MTTILLDRCWSDAIWKSRSRPRFTVPTAPSEPRASPREWEKR